MHRNFAFRLFAFLSLGVFLHAGVLFAQSGNSGTISGVVKDPSGAVVTGATVSINNPVSGYDRTTTTDSAGSFTFSNIPPNPYHLSVEAKGFGPYAQDVDVRSSVPITVNVAVTVAGSSTTVTVEGGADLIRKRVDLSHGRRSRAIRQTSAGESIVVGQLACNALNAGNCCRFERTFPRTRRSRRELVFRGWAAYHRPAKQGFLEPATDRLDPVSRSNRWRASGRIRRQNERCD